MKFPKKLWKLVNECTSGAICWGKDDNTIVVDMAKFKNEYLGESNDLFKTKSFTSFVRQLNLYGFRKCSKINDVHVFQSKYFVRGRKDLIKLLKRNLRCKAETDVHLTSFKSKMDKGSKGQDYREEKENSTRGISSFLTVENNQIFNRPVESEKPFPYNWWINPSYLGNIMHTMKHETMETNSLSGEDIAFQERKEKSEASNSPSMYRNVVFVPVPAYYTMPSGYYGKDIDNSIFFPKKEETTRSTVSHEG